MLPDLVTVSRSIEKRPQDEHVKRPLEEPDPLLCLLRHRRHSTLDLATMVDIRLSVVKDEPESFRAVISGNNFSPLRQALGEADWNQVLNAG